MHIELSTDNPSARGGVSYPGFNCTTLGCYSLCQSNSMCLGSINPVNNYTCYCSNGYLSPTNNGKNCTTAISKAKSTKFQLHLMSI